jgi:hypothetical protein
MEEILTVVSFHLASDFAFLTFELFYHLRYELERTLPIKDLFRVNRKMIIQHKACLNFRTLAKNLQVKQVFLARTF